MVSERLRGSTLSRRVQRYTKVSSVFGGLAARWAGYYYLGLGLDNDLHAADLRRTLGDLKGPLMKVAQMLSTIPNALPREYAEQLGQLRSNAPSMGWSFVKRRMRVELGDDWLSRFDNFEREAVAAASFGQVHRAYIDGGISVACKLQYPDMASVVETDLKQLKLLFSLYRRYDSSIDPSQIFDELADRLHEELDYHRELKHLSLYRAILCEEPGLNIAKPFCELSTQRLLTMGWLEGHSLLDYKESSQSIRNLLAMRLFRGWYLPFYKFGTIHADPHLGNYSVADDHTINLLDFGCVRLFRPTFVRGVIDLYEALQSGDRDLAVHAYETWGFSGLSEEVIEILNLWARFVYAPLLDDRTRQIQDVASEGVYGLDVAEKVHKGLREQGGVTPPREFVFMDRAAIGLGGVFLHLQAKLNWHQMLQGLIDGFDEESLKVRQTGLLTEIGLPAP